MKGITEVDDSEDSHGNRTILYKAHCYCGDDRHIMTLTMEHLADKAPADVGSTKKYDYNEITLTASFKFNVYDYYGVYWFKNKFVRLYSQFKNRIRMAFWILLFGSLPDELESDFMIGDLDQIDSFINALQKGKEKMFN